MSALLAAVCAPWGLAQTGKPRVEPPPPPTAEYNEKSWKEFFSAEGRFTVLLPGVPSERVEPVGDQAAGLTMHIFSLRTAYEYSIIYLDLPGTVDDPARVKTIFDAGRDNALATVKGKLLEEKDIKLDGHPGRYFKVQAPSGHTICSKAFLVGKRVYNLSIAFRSEGAPAAVVSFQNKTASKFLDSFKLPPGVTLNAADFAAAGGAQTQAAAGGEFDRAMKELRGRGEVIYVVADESGARRPDVEGVTEVSKDRVQSGKVISKPQPAYPAVARAARASGAVVVQVMVDEGGKVIAAQAVSGHPLLFQAAVAAARQMLFHPTLLDGKPVKVTGIVTYNFVLQ